MKPRVTDDLDGRSLFDVGYPRVLEIFSSPPVREMFPFSFDRETMLHPSHFLERKISQEEAKVSQIDESAFCINIPVEISCLVLYLGER